MPGMKCEVLKKAKGLKDHDYYPATSIRETASGLVGTAYWKDDLVSVTLMIDGDPESFLIQPEEFEKEFEIIDIMVDDGGQTKTFTAHDFLYHSFRGGLTMC